MESSGFESARRSDGRTDRWRRRWLVTVLGLLVLILCGYLGYPLFLTGLGSYLIVEMPIDQADAIVVLGGDAPYRAMEAAALYRAGRAPLVLLTRARRPDAYEVYEKLGITPPPDARIYEWKVLQRLGVPAEAIWLLDREVENTREELAEVVRWAEAHHSRGMILVTSKMHTRRVKALWGRVSGRRLHGVVVYSREDPFDPKKPWWRDRQFAGLVLHEYLGLANHWLGSPL